MFVFSSTVKITQHPSPHTQNYMSKRTVQRLKKQEGNFYLGCQKAVTKVEVLIFSESCRFLDRHRYKRQNQEQREESLAVMEFRVGFQRNNLNFQISKGVPLPSFTQP